MDASQLTSEITVQTLDGLVADMAPEDWEWGPIGDNTLGYCNWAKAVSKIIGEEYEVVWRRYRKQAEQKWKARHAR